jgi:hypothetical protein
MSTLSSIVGCHESRAPRCGEVTGRERECWLPSVEPLSCANASPICEQLLIAPEHETPPTPDKPFRAIPDLFSTEFASDENF